MSLKSLKTSMIQWPNNTIQFELVSQLRGKGRPRFTRTGRTYTPKETESYEHDVKMAYRLKSGYCSKNPIHMEIWAFKRIPDSYSKTKRSDIEAGIIKNTMKPDIDNIAKIVLDSLNKVAYEDDKQIIDLIVRKRWSKSGREKIIVRMTEIF